MSLNLDMNTSSSYSGITAPFKFDGKDYPLWKAQMLALLAMQGLSEFIVKSPQDIINNLPIKVVQGGSNSASNSSKDSKEELKEKNLIEETQAKAMKAYGLLLFCLARQQLGLFLDVEPGNPYELWKSLQDKYERKTMASVADTINALYECKMGKDSFDVYVSKIKLLVSRLKSMGEQYSEAQAMHVMFKGLPAIYEPIVQALKIQQNMNFTDACKHIRDCQDSIRSKESQEEGFANLTHGSFKGKGKYKDKSGQNNNNSDHGKKTFSCYTCGKSGHFAKDCYQSKTKKKCTYCKKSGHTIEECYSKKKEQSSGDGVQLLISELKSDPQSNSDNVAQANSAVVDNSSTRLKALFRMWVLDSGATHHLTNDRTQMFNIRKLENPIRLTIANGSTVYINEIGSVKFIAEDSGKEISMHDVGYAHGLAANLISLIKITEGGATINFTEKNATISRNNKVILKISKKENLYVIAQRAKLNLAAPIVEDKQVLDESLALWHNRLGHLSLTGVKKLAEGNSVCGLEKLKVTTKDISIHKAVCEGCVYGKAHRESFGNSIDAKYQAKDVLDRVHADLYGPININCDGEEIPILSGGKYVLQMVDEKSRKLFCFILQYKSDAEDYIINWINQVTVELGKPLKEFHSDGGGEFRSTKLLNYFKSKGIKVTFTNKGTPQHNSIVERDNRTINEMATSVLHHGKLPQLFWAEAVQISVYIRNRCLTTGNKTSKTPQEVWSGVKPNVEHIKVFGCNAYVHVQKTDRDNKFSAKAKSAVFLGYSSEKLGYRLLDLESKKIITSRDVIFDENKFDLALKFAENLGKNEVVNLENIHVMADKSDTEEPSAAVTVSNSVSIANPVAPVIQNDVREEKKAIEPIKLNHAESNNNFNENYDSDGLSDIESVPAEDNKSEPGAAVTSNAVNPGKKFMYPTKPEDAIIEGTRNRKPNYDPNIPYFSGNPSALLGYAFSATILEEPQTFEEAITCEDKDKWKEAMDLEFNSLMKNSTWTLTELPTQTDCKAIGSKWVYKKKLKSDGTVERYKARLVAQGFAQREGIDYNETFAPVVRYKTLRILMVIAANLNLELHQLDVETAFLNASIKEVVYMKQPKGYEKGNLVCKLNRTIYGIKQAPHEWNNELNSFIVIELGFSRCKSDTCVYVKRSKNDKIFILTIFVDDIIAAFDAIDMHEWLEYKKSISNKYKIRDIGEVDWILQMKVTRDRTKKTIILDQQRYIEKVLKEFNMLESKTIDTPASAEKLSTTDSPVTPEEYQAMKNKPYLNLVGSLLYAAITTRIDIAYAVNVATRFMSNPGDAHWKACKRILRYLNGTKKSGLIFHGNNSKEFTIKAYSDADWAGDTTDRKSTTGFVITINDSVVSWLSKKQSTVALSTAEAEYMAISATIQEVMWIYQLLEELKLPVKRPIELLCDNRAAISISSNDVNHSRTKHIDIRHHYIRDMIKKEYVKVSWIDTNKQLADILTKSLNKNQFNKFKTELMNVNYSETTTHSQA